MQALDEILHAVQYVVDEDGRRRAVQVDVSIWEQIVEWLEDLEDEADMRSLLEADDETVSWQDAKKQLRSDGVDL